MTRLQAIEESMGHWENDVIERLMNGEWEDIDRDRLCRGERCALCQEYYRKTWSCARCPLAIYADKCRYITRDNHWGEFMCKPTLENAINMWSLLCLLREIEVQGE